MTALVVGFVAGCIVGVVATLIGVVDWVVTRFKGPGAGK